MPSSISQTLLIIYGIYINGMGLQMAMDSEQIIFNWDEKTQKYRMELLDLSLSNETMREFCVRRKLDFTKLIPPLLANRTWQSFHGEAIHLQGSHEPSRRCMEFKARLGLMRAEERTWAPPGMLRVTSIATNGDYLEPMRLFFGGSLASENEPEVDDQPAATAAEEQPAADEQPAPDEQPPLALASYVL